MVVGTGVSSGKAIKWWCNAEVSLYIALLLQEHELTKDHFMPRHSELLMNEWTIGMVVYTGELTKFAMNGGWEGAKKAAAKEAEEKKKKEEVRVYFFFKIWILNNCSRHKRIFFDVGSPMRLGLEVRSVYEHKGGRKFARVLSLC